MGDSKVSLITDQSSRQEAMQHVLQDISALEYMLKEGMFETDVQRIGVEQELHFAGKDWGAAPVATKVLEELKEDPHFVTELALFNLEINLDPLEFTGGCLRKIEHQLYNSLKKVEMAARLYDAHAVLVGVLPTIRQGDIAMKNVTPLPRYKIMMDKLAKLRGEKFDFRIEGIDELVMSFPHAMFESVTASFQIHYQLAPEDFAPRYNWAQAITAPLMAASTNSPILLGRRLWKESRIALFQQSIDTRHSSQIIRQHPPRVSFGKEWVRNSVLEIFRNDIARYKAILISNRKEDAMQVLQDGGIPNLYGLCVHNGTVYKWNRACYGLTDGKPHLRIENRILPSGPSIVDEVANAAFWLGMMHGMPDEYAGLHENFEFDAARENFLRAARHGLSAEFRWIGNMQRIAAKQLILDELLPIAREGLAKAGVQTEDADHYLSIIEERVCSGQTGSQWLLSSFEKLKKKTGLNESLMAVTAGLSRRQQVGEPVHKWKLADLPEAGSWQNRYRVVEQVMCSDLFTVLEDDLVDYVARIMDWRNIRHVLVENDDGDLTGLVTSKNIIQFYAKHRENGATMSVDDIMTKELITVSPETSINDAIGLMREHHISCLPVVIDNRRLVGLVNERDFVRVTEEIFKETRSRKKSAYGKSPPSKG